MPRLGQVSRDDAHPFAQAIYKMIFGERDPVVEPGTALCSLPGQRLCFKTHPAPL